MLARLQNPQAVPSSCNTANLCKPHSHEQKKSNPVFFFGACCGEGGFGPVPSDCAEDQRASAKARDFGMNAVHGEFRHVVGKILGQTWGTFLGMLFQMGLFRS